MAPLARYSAEFSSNGGPSFVLQATKTTAEGPHAMLTMALTSVSAELRAMGCLQVLDAPSGAPTAAAASASKRVMASALPTVTPWPAHSDTDKVSIMAVDGVGESSSTDSESSSGAGADVGAVVAASTAGDMPQAYSQPAPASMFESALSRMIPSAADAVLQEAAAAARALSQRMKEEAAEATNSAKRIAKLVSPPLCSAVPT